MNAHSTNITTLEEIFLRGPYGLQMGGLYNLH